MASANQTIQFAPGEALTLTFTNEDADGNPVYGSIATWTLTFTARLSDGTIAFQCTVGNGITITVSGGVSTQGVYVVAPTAAQTAMFKANTSGWWDVWRTNSGSEAQLAVGRLEAGQQYRVG